MPALALVLGNPQGRDSSQSVKNLAINILQAKKSIYGRISSASERLHKLIEGLWKLLDCCALVPVGHPAIQCSNCMEASLTKQCVRNKVTKGHG